jgi:hypothetical protein
MMPCAAAPARPRPAPSVKETFSGQLGDTDGGGDGDVLGERAVAQVGLGDGAEDPVTHRVGGDPGVDLDVPEPAEGEVRVRIRTASVNGFDLVVAAGYTKNYMEHRFPAGARQGLRRRGRRSSRFRPRRSSRPGVTTRFAGSPNSSPAPKQAGGLREEFVAEDLPMLLMANAGVLAATAGAAPETHRGWSST